MKVLVLHPELHGRTFKAIIDGAHCEGKISKDGNYYYLCQNKKNGAACQERFGFRYSWSMPYNDVSKSVAVRELEIIDDRDPSTYKDWQIGDKITDVINSSLDSEVIFRSGELVIKKNVNGASRPYTCGELFATGFRLNVPKVEEPKFIELTVAEIAVRLCIPVDKLRIKD